MTTVSTVLNLALKDAQVIGEGETASAETTADALETLSEMLALWQIERMYVYAQKDDSFVPTGALSYTVGTLGTIPITRPVKIDAAFWRLNGVDTPIQVLNTFEEYESIVSKTSAGNPCVLFYQSSYTLGTLYLYPQPSTGTVHLITRVQLPEPTSTADTLTLPPEYVMPIRASLAEMLCALFHTPLSPDIASLAARSRKILKRNNLRIKALQMPAALVRGAYNIITGS